ncbi:MAG: hypothetical protein MJK04_16915 [Psychrosphaera sp.]|nr:hypothetical protein [Psychrosphaera sp.]
MGLQFEPIEKIEMNIIDICPLLFAIYRLFLRFDELPFRVIDHKPQHKQQKDPQCRNNFTNN